MEGTAVKVLIIKSLELTTGKSQSITTLLLPHCVSVNRIPWFLCPRGNREEFLLLKALWDGVGRLKQQKGKPEDGQRDGDVIFCNVLCAGEVLVSGEWPGGLSSASTLI